MSPDIVRADLAILIAVGIVTELLRFILIKIEVHDVPFSVGVAKGEERDRLLQQGDNFHTSIVHCPTWRIPQKPLYLSLCPETFSRWLEP